MVDLLPFDLLDDIFCETQTFFDFYCDDGNLESLDNFSFVPLDDIIPDVVDSVVRDSVVTNEPIVKLEGDSTITSDLRVSMDDERRSFLSTFFRHINRSKYALLSAFLNEHCVKDVIFEIKSDNKLGEDGFYTMPNMPRALLITGVEAFVNMAAAMGECVPDRYYQLSETIIRNRADCSFIIGKFTLTGTIVFQIKSKSSDVKIEEDSSKEINEKKRIRGLDAAFQDLKITGEEMNIGEKPIQFAPGNLFKEFATPIPPVKYSGVATLYLNAEKQIRKVVWDYSGTRNENWIQITKKKSEKKGK